MACILIIDDEDDLRRSMRDALEEAGHDVLEAENGARALDLLERKSADLIVTDIMMPETDGIEVVISLRRENPDLPIIAISGGGRMGSTNYLILAEKLGANQILRKPFRRLQLVGAVRDCLAAAG